MGELTYWFCILSLIVGDAFALKAIPTPGTKCTNQVTFKVQNSGVTKFPKKIEVFGIPLIATSAFAQATEGGKNKLQHVASVLAELIDNDNDGCADDPNVLAKLLSKVNGNKKRTFYLQDKAQNDVSQQTIQSMLKAGFQPVQMVAADETHPACSGLKTTGKCRDAAVEEALHLVNAHGHALAHPKVFGSKWTSKSKLTNALDKARGKRIQQTPNNLSSYPSSAWFTYADSTCTYNCQAIEYLWWGYAAYTGIGNGLANSTKFSKEFKLLKQTDFNKKDTLLKAIFDLSKSGKATYRHPTNVVDGAYTGCPVCAKGTNHGGSTSTTTATTTTSATTKTTAKTTTTAKATTTAKSTGTNLTGEQACEGKGLSKTQCQAVGCCSWEDGQCFSAVRNNLCSGF